MALNQLLDIIVTENNIITNGALVWINENNNQYIYFVLRGLPVAEF